MKLVTKNRHTLNEFTVRHTAFSDFSDLVTAKGNYSPSIYWPTEGGTFAHGETLTAERRGYELAVLANSYDQYMASHGDPRRAYRGGNWPAEMIVKPSAHGLFAGDGMSEFINQAERYGYVLATSGDDILWVYEMPAGRKFLTVLTYGRQRSKPVSLKSLPKRWVKAMIEQGAAFTLDDALDNLGYNLGDGRPCKFRATYREQARAKLPGWLYTLNNLPLPAL